MKLSASLAHIFSSSKLTENGPFFRNFWSVCTALRLTEAEMRLASVEQACWKTCIRLTLAANGCVPLSEQTSSADEIVAPNCS